MRDVRYGGSRPMVPFPHLRTLIIPSIEDVNNFKWNIQEHMPNLHQVFLSGPPPIRDYHNANFTRSLVRSLPEAIYKFPWPVAVHIECRPDGHVINCANHYQQHGRSTVSYTQHTPARLGTLHIWPVLVEDDHQRQTALRQLLDMSQQSGSAHKVRTSA
jgi:hypothetical protein